MNIELIVVGKTDSKEVEALVSMYTRRLSHYVRFGITTLPDLRNTKNLSSRQQNKSEGDRILALLDEGGKEFRSVEYAEWIEKKMASGLRRLVFVIGGPYGFSEAVYKRADAKVSLSKMTFSHQIVRAIFTEQLYRAFTIIKGEPYHHE